jgi:N-acetylglucosaminyl-diphospho-decaprenol L-rhamnosyltransferase
MQSAKMSLSIVSHAQIGLISRLLNDLQEHCAHRDIEIILTLNLPEQLPFDENSFAFPIKLIKNPTPLGFGANHNQAFAASSGAYFCILNPDILLQSDPFDALLLALTDIGTGVVAPRVVNVEGGLEDSARFFPTPIEIIGKVFGRPSNVYKSDAVIGFPDWVAGMFMLLKREVFHEIQGFDTRYFMYYEDVDLCATLAAHGYRSALCNSVTVIHDARRTSHRKLRYLKWHLTSMLRFFLYRYARKWLGIGRPGERVK